MERIERSLKGRYWRKIITYFLTCCLFLNASLPAVMAGPTGGVVDTNPVNGGGTAEILYGQGPYEHTTQVNVDSTRTIIDWESLDTAGGLAEVRETLAFSQALPDSAVLNRVSGAATQFNGDLVAPGMSIFIVNPAGVIFGSGSTVNVTQLVASGLNMSNDAFHAILDDPINNKMEFVGGDGEVITRADITADSVILIGKKVYNIGTIRAHDGLVVMAAGDEVRLYENGSDVSVIVNSEGDGFGNPDVRNGSNIDVLNGRIVLAAGDTFSRAISNVAILAAQGGTVTARAALIENRQMIDVSAYPSGADGDGGSISLIATEQVIIDEDKLGVPATMNANAGANGSGGTITIQAGTETVEGMVTIGENSVIRASGNGESGKGGTVTITSDNFEILGDISASPANKTAEPGELVINSPSVIIADGPNTGATDTLYEEDIENLSQGATSLVVNAQEDITVNDITDNEITGQFGSIELHATGDDSAVTFADNTVDGTPEISDTIRTTLGDIVIEAGSGGINAGNLTTGKDLPDDKPAPGEIFLTTHNGGNITTGDLIVRDGWGDGEIDAEIDVKSSGNLTVNGDVIVGSESAILNVADERAAEAVIMLKADNDVTLNGNVEANAHGSEEDTSITKAYIDVIAGNNANINGDILAGATSSSSGTADAVITVDAVGDITFQEGAEVHAVANDAAAESTGPDYEDDEVTLGSGHAKITINDSATFLVDDDFSTNKSASIETDVLINDTLEEGDSIDSYDIDPADGSLTEVKEDGLIMGFIYNPPEDLGTLTFDQNGEAVVTFTYTVNGRTATVTITLTNSLPVAVEDIATTYIGQSVSGNVLTNDVDADLVDDLTAVLGTITTKNGTLVLNEDGTFTYKPDEGFLGDDSFTYKANDGYNESEEVKVKITVTEEPPPSPAKSKTPALPYIPPAPFPEIMKFEISGYPALAKWVALELGVDERMIDIWAVNTLASTRNIQPYETYTSLKAAAIILADDDGTHIAALAQVVSEFASSNTPPTEEQMTSIADAIARNTDEDSYYAVAGEYLDALATYIGILNEEMGFSAAESVQIVTDKYVGRLAKSDNVGVAAFVAASLAALGG